MSGPPPKDPARRQRTNTPSLNLVIPADPSQSVTKSPPPSADWLAVTRDDWLALWDDPLVSAVYNVATDGPSLRRLFGLRDDRERFRRAVRKTPLVEGSQGQPVANPLASMIAPLDSEIRQLEDRFGLNPKARLGLGIKLGKAAKSLDDLTRGLYGDENQAAEEPDPRSGAVTAKSSRKA